MKGLRKLFEEIINEITVSQIRDKYYSDIEERVFNEIVSADPKTKKKGGEIKKIGKYAKILLKIYKSGNLKLEDLPKATDYLGVVYSKQIPLKANEIRSIGDIYSIVKDYMIVDGETDISKLIDSLDADDYELIHNGSDWLIFKPKTRKGACILGSATEWCTAWGEHSTNPKYKGRKSHFDRYGSSGSIYTLINKKDNSHKYQFHLETKQYMDKGDRQININRFLTNNNEVLLFFNPELSGDISEVSDDDLDSILNRDLMTNKGMGLVINELVRRNKEKPIVSAFTKAEEGGNNDYLFKELNKLINSEDFKIYLIDSHDAKFEKLEDEDLEVYDRLGYTGHYEGDNIDEETSEGYYNNSLEEIFKQKGKGLIKLIQNSEGLDIRGFLEFQNKFKSHGIGDFDVDFLEWLIDNSGKKGDYLEKISDIVRETDESANSEATDEVQLKAENLFSISNRVITRNIFLLFLMRYDEYDMDNFKDFLETTFDLPVKYYDIYEAINERKWGLMDVDVDEIVNYFDDIVDEMIDWFIDEYEDDIIEYHNSEGDWLSSISSDEYDDKLEVLVDKVYSIIRKHGKFINNSNIVLKIYDNKINIKDESIYISFEDKIGGKKVDGYVKINRLHNYISYGKNSPKFWGKLEKIMKGLNLDIKKDEFENEIVKIKLYYDDVDVDGDKIYMDITNKETDKTNSGFIKLDDFATQFTNYKLFEEINRFKRYIK